MMKTATPTPPGHLRPLAEVLTYANAEIAQRLLNKCPYSLSPHEGQTLFEDTLRWLWLNAKAMQDPAAPELMIEDRMELLDEGWHNFLMFTGPYRDFCQDYLGRFIDHQPCGIEERQAEKSQDPAVLKAAAEKHQQFMRTMMEYVHSHLGADVLVRWFREYPARYVDQQRKTQAA